MRQRMQLRFLLVLGPSPQVHYRHWKMCSRPKALERLTGNMTKSCAQYFVTPDDFLEALLQCRHVQRTTQTYRFQKVIGMAAEP
jgi:hypothetical protein